MKKWKLVQDQPYLRKIFKELPIISLQERKIIKGHAPWRQKKGLTKGLTPVWISGLTPLAFSLTTGLRVF